MSEFKIKVSVDLDTKNIEGQLNELTKDQEIKATVDMSKIKKQIQDIKKDFQNAFKFTSKDLGGLDKLIKTLAKLNSETSSGNGAKKVTNLVKEYKELANTVSKLQKQLDKGGLGEKSVERTKTQMTEMLTQMQKIKSQMSALEKIEIDLFNQKMDNKALVDMNNYISKIEASVSSLQTRLNSTSFNHIDTDIISKLESRLKEIKNTAENIDINFEMDGINNILSDLSKIKSEIKNLEKVENLAGSFDKIANSANEAGIEIKDLEGIISKLASEASSLDGSFEKAFSNAKNEANELKNEIKEVQSAMKKTSKESKSSGGMLGSWDDFTGNFAQFTLAEVAGDFLSGLIRTAVDGIINTVVETDKAITDLGKVYDNLNGERLKEYLTDVSNVAKTTGKTSVDVINGTAKAIQSGIKDIDNALIFAQQSAIYSNVADMEQEQADQILTSVLSAYGGVEQSLKPVREQVQGMSKDYSTLNKVMDLTNYAGNKFAVTSADVGIALQNSAAALQANGVSMEESVGMVVAMNEVLQDSSKSGNALKSISAGLAGVGVSAKDGTVQLTKSGMALKEIAGIDVWNKKTGEIKDMYEIMDELYDKWDDLSEAEQNALGTAIAGKTQLNAFNALLSNWKTAKQYVQDYKQGLTIGSAEKENLKYLDSIQGKWNVIKENLKEVANTLVSSDMAKGFLDGLIIITDGLNSFVKGFSNIFSSFAEGNLGKKISDYIYESLEGLGINNKFTTSLSSGVGGAIGKFFEEIKDLAIGNTLLGQFQRISGMIQKVANLFPEDSFMDIMGDRLASVDEAIDYKLLGGQKRLNKQIEERQANVQSIEMEIQALENQKQAIDDIMEEYDKLSSKTNRTTKENQRLTEIQNQLAESNPDLVLGYDSDGNAILKNLKLQNKEIEQQILLKRQAQRLEENELANDVLERKTKEQKDYNKAIEAYNNMSNVSNTKRKKGLFGEESIQDYASRIEENNKEIAKSNERAYNQRLKDHQQYLEDEKVLQEKYINQMESNSNFAEKSKEQQADILTFMDALDWTNFDTVTGNRFTNQLSELDNEIVRSTKDMGDHAKAIQQLTDSYASGEINLKQYTDGLTKQYEAAGKFDTESFLAWRQGLQSYIDTTGDIVGANKAIDEMAKTLSKVTGISTETFKTALAFDPAPIDASNKALQKFLNTYGTGVQNLGKGGNADKLTAQFQSLQSSYEQMVSDLADGKEIDVEYLVNATVGNPDCIQKLVKEIVADGEVTPEEMEILLEVQASILNGEDISDDVVKKIAEIFGLSEQEVRVMLNIDAKKTKNAEEVKGFWENVKDKTLELSIKVFGEKTVKDVQQAWENMKNKIVDLTVKIIGKENIEKIKEIWEKWKDKAVELKVKISDTVKKFQETWEKIKNKTAELTANIKNSEIVQKVATLWEDFKSKSAELAINIKNFDLSKELKEIWENIKDKTSELAIKILGEENIEKLSIAWEKFKDRYVELAVNIKNSEIVQKVLETWEKIKNKTAELTANIKNGETIQKVLELWEKFKNKTAELTTNIKNSETVQGILELWEKIKNKSVELTTNIKNSEAVQNILELWEKIKSKTVELVANVKDQAVKTLSEAWGSFVDKTVELTCSVLDGSLVTNLKNAWDSIRTKAVELKAGVTGTELVQKLKDLWAFIKSKTAQITAKVSGSKAVETLKSLWGSIVSKTVTLTTKTKNIVSNVVEWITGKRSIEPPTKASSTSMLSNSPLASMPVSASSDMVTASDTPSLANTSVSASANNAFGGTLDANKILSSLDFDVSHIKNLEEALERLGNQLDLIDKKSEMAFGQEKVDLLQQQIPLLKEQQRIQEQIAKNELAQNNELIYWLNNQGFKFDSLGNITNYNNKLLEMERNVESLKKKHDDLNSVSGDNKNETAIKNANQAYEEANETLSKTKKYLEEYFTTNNKELIEASQKWWEYESAIRDAEQAINDVCNSLLENKIDAVGDSIDFLDAKIKMMNSQDKIAYIKEQNELYRQQQNLLHQLAEQYRAQLATLNPLSEEYAQLSSEIKRLSTEWWNLENAMASNKMSIMETETIGLRNEIDLLTDSIAFLDAKMGSYDGAEKITIIEQQNALYRQQQELLHQLAEQLRAQLAMMEQGTQEAIELQRQINALSTEWWDIESNIVSNNNWVTNYYDDLAREAERAYEEAQRAAEEAAREAEEAARQAEEQRKEQERIRKEQKLNPLRDNLEEVNNILEEVNNRLELLNSLNERSQGKTKIDYYCDQIDLLNEKLKVYEKEIKSINNLAGGLASELSKYGFAVGVDGLLFNYDEVLGALAGSERYDEAKSLADEYMSLINSDYADAKKSIVDINNEIKNLQEEILKAERELMLFSSKNKLTELNEEFEELSNKLDIIGSRLEYAFGTDKISLMKEEVRLLNKQLEIQADKMNVMDKQMQIYADSLSEYGFMFDADGDISNYVEIMDKYRDDEKIESIKELCEEYMDLCKEIEDLSSTYVDLEKSVKDAYNEMLETTKDIEDEITKAVEKEYEKRQKEVEDYTDERIKLLEKEKRAMQDLWDNQDYEESVEEQSKKIMDLQKRINVLMGDTSIAGQQKLKELTEELAEAKKELEELTEDKIRNDYESNIDSEIEKLEKEEESILEALEEKFSEVNIAKIVGEALTSGFIEINGEIQSVQDVLINNINETAEGYSVMAEVIKNQLVANLNVALNTTKELADIYKNLDLNEYGRISALENISTSTPNAFKGTSNVTFGDTIFNVSGSADSTTLEQVEEMIKQSQEEMLDKITRDM